jgi:endonuclease YncB( thermonuclease family)
MRPQPEGIVRQGLLVVVLLALGAVAAPAGAAITSYAIVRDDATLQLQGRTIRLFGIYLPDAGRTCRFRVSPVRCSSRAALALDDKIRGFVRCEPVAEYPDRSLAAVCFSRGVSILAPEVDLGAWLIEQGLAVATPAAPFEYHVLQEIAQSRRAGLWGFFADDIRPRSRLHR